MNRLERVGRRTVIAMLVAVVIALVMWWLG